MIQLNFSTPQQQGRSAVQAGAGLQAVAQGVGQAAGAVANIAQLQHQKRQRLDAENMQDAASRRMVAIQDGIREYEQLLAQGQFDKALEAKQGLNSLIDVDGDSFIPLSEARKEGRPPLTERMEELYKTQARTQFAQLQASMGAAYDTAYLGHISKDWLSSQASITEAASLDRDNFIVGAPPTATALGEIIENAAEAFGPDGFLAFATPAFREEQKARYAKIIQQHIQTALLDLDQVVGVDRNTIIQSMADTLEADQVLPAEAKIAMRGQLLSRRQQEKQTARPLLNTFANALNYFRQNPSNASPGMLRAMASDAQEAVANTHYNTEGEATELGVWSSALSSMAEAMEGNKTPAEIAAMLGVSPTGSGVTNNLLAAMSDLGIAADVSLHSDRFNRLLSVAGQGELTEEALFTFVTDIGSDLEGGRFVSEKDAMEAAQMAGAVESALVWVTDPNAGSRIQADIVSGRITNPKYGEALMKLTFAMQRTTRETAGQALSEILGVFDEARGQKDFSMMKEATVQLGTLLNSELAGFLTPKQRTKAEDYYVPAAAFIGGANIGGDAEGLIGAPGSSGAYKKANQLLRLQQDIMEEHSNDPVQGLSRIDPSFAERVTDLVQLWEQEKGPSALYEQQARELLQEANERKGNESPGNAVLFAAETSSTLNQMLDEGDFDADKISAVLRDFHTMNPDNAAEVWAAQNLVRGPNQALAQLAHFYIQANHGASPVIMNAAVAMYDQRRSSDYSAPTHDVVGGQARRHLQLRGLGFDGIAEQYQRTGNTELATIYRDMAAFTVEEVAKRISVRDGDPARFADFIVGDVIKQSAHVGRIFGNTERSFNFSGLVSSALREADSILAHNLRVSSSMLLNLGDPSTGLRPGEKLSAIAQDAAASAEQVKQRRVDRAFTDRMWNPQFQVGIRTAARPQDKYYHVENSLFKRLAAWLGGQPEGKALDEINDVLLRTTFDLVTEQIINFESQEEREQAMLSLLGISDIETAANSDRLKKEMAKISNTDVARAVQRAMLKGEISLNFPMLSKEDGQYYYGIFSTVEVEHSDSDVGGVPRTAMVKGLKISERDLLERALKRTEKQRTEDPPEPTDLNLTFPF